MPKHAEIARERAIAAAQAPRNNATPDGRTRSRRLAIGDPQAPLERFFEVLELHGALGGDGLLAPDVLLVSMGDHFDWGKREDREKATDDGLALLAWLAMHPPDHAVILAGNHDLGRVGELLRYDDRNFPLARGEADVIYGDGKRKASAAAANMTGEETGSTSILEARFRKLHPDLPTTEIASRDFSTFKVAQRVLVEELLRAKRMRIAYAAGPRLLLVHAGVTVADLDAIGVSARARVDAILVAAALNTFLDDAVAAWKGNAPLELGPLHRPGSAVSGEGRGIFYHRPSNPQYEHPAFFEGPPRRRFDPRTLPLGLVQAIGHIRDAKCRSLLKDWHDGTPPVDGPLRHLVTDGTKVRYARGLPAKWSEKHAGMIFLDGGMSHTEPASYELLDLATAMPAAKR